MQLTGTEMQLLAKEHQWASSYRDQIPAGFFKRELLPPPPRGGQTRVTPGSCISIMILIKAFGYSGNFCLRKVWDFSQECGVLLETCWTPPSLLRLLKLFSHSLYVSWCNKAYTLPKAKSIQPTGLADHAHLSSSIHRFNQALFRSEPWNTLCVPLTMLAPMHRLEERKWMKHQPANW